MLDFKCMNQAPMPTFANKVEQRATKSYLGVISENSTHLCEPLRRKDGKVL